MCVIWIYWEWVQKQCRRVCVCARARVSSQLSLGLQNIDIFCQNLEYVFFIFPSYQKVALINSLLCVCVCVCSVHTDHVCICVVENRCLLIWQFSPPSFGWQQTRGHRDACGDSQLLISSSSASHPSFHPPTTPFILSSHYQHRNPQPMGNYSVLRLTLLSKIFFFLSRDTPNQLSQNTISSHLMGRGLYWKRPLRLFSFYWTRLDPLRSEMWFFFFFLRESWPGTAATHTLKAQNVRFSSILW